MEYKFDIIILDNLRYELIEKEQRNDASEEEIKQIDQLSNQIVERIKESFDNLSFEFILDQLSRLGDAPCLLYDDDGHWSITSDGIATISIDGPLDWRGSFSVAKKDWYNTPREALFNYLKTSYE